jgi:heat shock factor-binding protein 1
MSPALENQETLGQPSVKEKHESAADKRQDPELTVVIEDLLEQMQEKFNHMGGSIMGKMDEMGTRMDELERSIGQLMEQTGLENPTTTPALYRNSPTAKENSEVSAPASSVEI